MNLRDNFETAEDHESNNQEQESFNTVRLYGVDEYDKAVEICLSSISLLDNYKQSNFTKIQFLKNFYINNTTSTFKEKFSFPDFLQDLNIPFLKTNVFELPNGNILNLEHLSTEVFNKVVGNIRIFLSEYNLSDFSFEINDQDVYFVSNSDSYLKYQINQDSIFKITDGLNSQLEVIKQRIVKDLDLDPNFELDHLLELVFIDSHFDSSYFEIIKDYFDRGNFFIETLDLNRGTKTIQKFDLSLDGFSLNVSSVFDFYNSSNCLIREEKGKEKFTYEYDENGILYKRTCFDGNKVKYFELFEGNDYPSKRVFPSDLVDCGLVLNNESEIIYKYIIVKSTNTLISSFEVMKKLNPELTEDDYFKILAENISDPVVYVYFYEHLFEYTSDVRSMNVNDSVRDGEYHQSYRETMLRTSQGSLMGDCEDIALFMNKVLSANHNNLKVFTLGIPGHSLTVSIKLRDDNRWEITRYGTGGSQRYVESTFEDAMNRLLSRYDRVAEGYNNPNFSRISDGFQFLYRSSDSSSIITVPKELFFFIDNSNLLKDVFDQIYQNEGLNTKYFSIKHEHDSIFKIGEYEFDFQLINVNDYFRNIVKFHLDLKRNPNKDNILKVLNEFEEFVSSSSVSADKFNFNRQLLVTELLENTSNENALFILNTIHSQYPTVDIYIDVLNHLNGVEPNMSLMSYLNIFLENPNELNLSMLIVNPLCNSSILDQVIVKLAQLKDVNLYLDFYSIFPSRFNVGTILLCQNELNSENKNKLLDFLSSIILSLDKQFISYSIEIICKFMPEKLDFILELFYESLTYTSINAFNSRIDNFRLSEFNNVLVKYKVNAVYSRNFIDFIDVMLNHSQELNNLTQNKLNYLSNAKVFYIYLKILKHKTDSRHQILSVVKLLLEINNRSLKIVFVNFLKSNIFKDSILERDKTKFLSFFN